MMKNMLSGLVLLSAMIYSVAGQCGGSLSATSNLQVLSTPNYPAYYPSHLDCVWVIRSSVAGKQVEVQFTKVKTEKCCDFLKVRDGQSASDQVLLTPLSGNGNTSWNFVSTFSALYIEFKSDDSIEKQGFEAKYRIAHVKDSTCGGNINLAGTDPSHISSPNYLSGKYPSGSYCLWTIIAPFGRQVNLTITNYQMESCCDGLVVRDGTDQSSRILGFVTGTWKKNIFYVSTGGKLFLRFRSDSSYNFKGFIGRARAVVVPTRPTPTPPVPDCKQNLSVPLTGHGNFTTPNYPIRYLSNLECYWVLRAPNGSRIHLWFGLIDTEPCCDWIKVRDGPNYDSPKIDVISGTPAMSLPNYVSTSNEMRVGFDTDETINQHGFRAYYEIYKAGHFESTSVCGGRLTATNTVQYFSSPNFPAAYGHSRDCTWRIEAPRGTRMKVVLLSAHLEKKYDTLTVYQVRFPFDKKIFTFSGSYLAIYRLTVSNVVKVVLSSDSSVSFAGFRASYVIDPANP